jgi:hypothetical protein
MWSMQLLSIHEQPIFTSGAYFCEMPFQMETNKQHFSEKLWKKRDFSMRFFMVHNITQQYSGIIRFFQFFTMDKMVICSMYMVWKKFHPVPR